MTELNMNGSGRRLQIVVVEDHEEYREALTEFLEKDGHHVLSFESSEHLGNSHLPEGIDLFIIDLNLPGEDGLVLAQRLRKSMPNVGILMLTARDFPDDVTRGYQSGADIYLNKPASAAQLRAALGALVRRLYGADDTDENQPVLTQRQLQGSSGEVMLTTTETLLLRGLARAPGRQITSEQLILAIGKTVQAYQKHALEAAMARLRKKIFEACGDDLLLLSVRGEGYRLSAAVKIL